MLKIFVSSVKFENLAKLVEFLKNEMGRGGFSLETSNGESGTASCDVELTIEIPTYPGDRYGPGERMGIEYRTLLSVVNALGVMRRDYPLSEGDGIEGVLELLPKHENLRISLSTVDRED